MSIVDTNDKIFSKKNKRSPRSFYKRYENRKDRHWFNQKPIREIEDYDFLINKKRKKTISKYYFSYLYSYKYINGLINKFIGKNVNDLHSFLKNKSKIDIHNIYELRFFKENSDHRNYNDHLINVCIDEDFNIYKYYTLTFSLK